MLLQGMYVSCQVIKRGITVNVMGKVIEYDTFTKVVDVVFYDRNHHNFHLQILDDNHKRYFDFEIDRISVSCPCSAQWKKFDVQIICELEPDKDNYKQYACKYRHNNRTYIKKIQESDLVIDFYNIKNDAKDEAYRFKNSDLNLFFARQFLSKRRTFMDSIQNIYFSLINTRVFLYPHQLDTVIKATKGTYTRMMLADEVGLGKTIEALTILKYYLQETPLFRCIIVVPDSLVYQWLNEINERFRISAEVFSYTRVKYKRTRANVFIITYGEYYKYRYDIEEMNWDMIIIDEAHKILNGPYYATLFSASVKIRNVIMLSATPVISEGSEYLRLMKLVNPRRYKDVDEKQFRKMMEIQKSVSSSLIDMNTDIVLYNKMDMKDTFIENLEELNRNLNDNYLGLVISAIKKDSDDNGLYAVQLAMEYLRQKYVVESNIIRHRREDVKEGRIKRNLLDTYTYIMKGADFEIYESDVYEAVLSIAANKINKGNKGKWIKAIEAMHSSPYALLPRLLELDIPNSDKTECINILNKWKNYCDLDIKRLKRGFANKNTRLGCLITAIESSDANKIVIFSAFKETVKVIYELIQARFGVESSVMFNSEMSRLEVQLAARKFQNKENCRFIICDESGGEGRNFQIADIIIHFDISWSPAVMEQRIGRLDRIGRNVNKDVNSIVIYAEDTVEERIYGIHNNTLNVFSQCLSGIEIIFDDLQEKITDAFVIDPLNGLQYINDDISSLKERMETELADEIYFSACNERDANEMSYIRKVSDAFEKQREKEAEDNILVLLNKSGLYGTRDQKAQMVNIEFNRADEIVWQLDLFYEAFSMDECKGTFRREIAMNDDSIEYFSPNHSIYKTFMKQIDRKQRGRFLALSTSKKVQWAGFLFVWNMEIDQVRLLKGGLNPERYHYLKRYLGEQQIINTFRIYGTEIINEDDLILTLKNKEVKVVQHIEDTVAFGREYDEGSWEEYINNVLIDASERAKCTAKASLKEKELRDWLNKERISLEIEKKTVCFPYEKSRKKENAIVSAVLHLKPEIDSILYLEV